MTAVHPDTRTPPGPRARFPGHMLFEFARRRLPFLIESAEKYGDIVFFKVGNERIYLFNHPDLIRDVLVQQTWERPDSNVVGTVTLVYDHHVRLLNEKLTDLQHSHFHHILSTLHVHLDHDNCLEVLVVKGRVSVVKKIADALISTKGVKHGRLTITSTGAEL